MTTIRCRFPAARRPKPPPTKPVVSPAARMLALAHHVDRLVESGGLPDYAAAARALGVTRARVTQIMKLVLLEPGLQEKVLLGEHGSERGLRRATHEPVWEEQQP